MKKISARQNWSPLAHGVYRLIKENPQIPRGEWLLGWSGGADSTALLWVLSQLASALEIRLHVLTVHHGPGPWEKQRDQMEIFCAKHISQFKCSWQVIRSSELLSSEADLRKFRRSVLVETAKERGSSAIALGHHLDDLLETRLLRLMRGTGPQGLRAMKAWRAPFFRPFLQIPKVQLLQELRKNGIPWFEDASNVDNGPQRNWLRNEILPQLQSRDPGIVVNLSRSLELIIEALQEKEVGQRLFDLAGGFRRDVYLGLQPSERQGLVFRYLQTLGVPDVRQSQVKEICRQLDKARTVDKFRVARCEWIVNAQQVQARLD